MLEGRPMLREKIKQIAKEIGFDLVGFSPAKIEDKYLQEFDAWLSANNEADMAYMRKIDQRRDLTQILPGAKSVIVLGMNYYREQPDLKPGHGIVARYAYGRDYHKIISKKLKELCARIKELAPDEETKAYVDTGPLMERALAEQAGIGRIGKNGCVISKDFGSWIFLSEIITTLDLTEEKPFPGTNEKIDRWSDNNQKSGNVCGNCTKCIDACPTGAIIAPGVIDSRLCISYLTIENKGKIPPKLAKIIAKTKRLYGCDICQEVCPHNEARQRINTHPEFHSPIAGDQLSLKKVQSLKNDDEFLQTFAGSPLMRAKRSGLQRNANLLEGPIAINLL